MMAQEPEIFAWEDDQQALDYLMAGGLRPHRGVFHLRSDFEPSSEMEESAIAYLCAEWDYEVRQDLG